MTPPLPLSHPAKRALHSRTRRPHWARNYYDPLHEARGEDLEDLEVIKLLLGEIMVERLQPASSSRPTKVVVDVHKEDRTAIGRLFRVDDEQAMDIAVMWMEFVGRLATGKRGLTTFDKDHAQALRACASNPDAFLDLLSLVVDVMLFRRDADPTVARHHRDAIVAHYTKKLHDDAVVGGRRVKPKKKKKKKKETRRLRRRV